MLKILTTITTLLLSILSLAQAEENNLQADIRGRDCSGGSGLCSITSSSLSDVKATKVMISSQSQNTIVLDLDLNQLSFEKQKIHFGKEFTKSSITENLYFIQDDNFIFDKKSLLSFGIDSKNNLLLKGLYPTKILKDRVQVILTLSQQ